MVLFNKQSRTSWRNRNQKSPAAVGIRVDSGTLLLLSSKKSDLLCCSRWRRSPEWFGGGAKSVKCIVITRACYFPFFDDRKFSWSLTFFLLPHRGRQMCFKLCSMKTQGNNLKLYSFGVRCWNRVPRALEDPPAFLSFHFRRLLPINLCHGSSPTQSFQRCTAKQYHACVLLIWSVFVVGIDYFSFGKKFWRVT